jgi:hypothetical protein
VECGLKACVLAHIERTGVIFEDKKYAEKCWTHDLEELLRLSGVQADFDVDAGADAELLENWGLVRDWTELSRYARTAKDQAELLYDAVTDKKHGVLTWIKVRW